MDSSMTDVASHNHDSLCNTKQEEPSLWVDIVKGNNQGVALLLGESCDLSVAGQHLKKSLNRAKYLMPFLQEHVKAERFQFSKVAKSLYIYQRGEYDEGMNSFSYPVLIDEGVPSVNIVLATINFNLGQLYLRLNNDAEALSHFLRALKVGQWQDGVCEKFLGGVSLMAVLHNIGHVHYRNGHYEDAIMAYQKALDIDRDVCYRTCHPHRILGIADTLNCLGVLYFQLPKANPTKALELLQESLSIRRSILGFNYEDRQFANILNNIGRVHYVLGEYDKARDYYSQALGIRTRLFGKDHLDVAACTFNLAQILHRAGEAKAMELYEEFLRIARDGLGYQHRDIAGVLKCMAQAKHEAKDFERAVELYKEAMEVCKATLGTCHPMYASILNKLGNIYYETNDLESAAQAYQLGLEVERTVFEPDNPNIVVTLQNLAEIYRLENKLELSLRYYRQVLAILRLAVEKSDCQSLSTTLSSIALIHYQSRRFSMSLEVYQEVLSIQRQTYGDNSLEVGSTLNAVALVLYKMDLHELALQSFSESLNIRRGILGGERKEIAVVLFNLATVHLEMGDGEEALALYHEALRVEKIALGRTHNDVIRTMMHIGRVHQQRGEMSDALEYYQQALDASSSSCRQIDHAAMARIMNHIGNVYLQRGNARELVAVLSESIRHFQLAGMGENELELSGFNFYALSKRHPECAATA